MYDYFKSYNTNNCMIRPTLAIITIKRKNTIIWRGIYDKEDEDNGWK